MPYICMISYVLLIKLAYGHFLSYRVNPVIKVFLYFLNLFTQGFILTLTLRGLIRRN